MSLPLPPTPPLLPPLVLLFTCEAESGACCLAGQPPGIPLPHTSMPHGSSGPSDHQILCTPCPAACHRWPVLLDHMTNKDADHHGLPYDMSEEMYDWFARART